MITIRRTKSLSPITNCEVDAEIIKEDGNVYLLKQDENGKSYKSLIEKDEDFYELMTSETVPCQVEPNAIFLYVSGRCNLNCPICYEAGGEHKEISLKEIEYRLARVKNKAISLMGKEPTCREDIFEIIKVAAKNNRCSLLTNGLKLVNYDYTARLKEAGVDIVTLSFNGFDDEIYKEMNGKPLLDIKLKALDNLGRVGLKTMISVTINRGTNEGEIRKICDFCFENRSYIYEMRIRTVSTVGQHLDAEPYCMSEMIDLVARALEIPKEDIIKEQIFWKELIKELGPLIPEQIKAFARTRLCSFNFHVTRNERYTCLGSHVNMDALKQSKFRKARFIYDLIRNYGPKYLTQSACMFLKIPFNPGEVNNIAIVLRSWPNLYNIDLVENRKCSSQYLRDGEYSPFCYSNIVGDKIAARGKND
jgi:uncharacterized radical SAM superfamily Fe-S cluster-containing enzyme